MTALPATAAGNRPALIYQPDSAVFWVFVAALALGLGRLLTLQGSALHEALDANLELAGVWLAFVVFMVWLMLRFDPFRAMRPYPQVLAASTALGAATATAMAIDGNDALNTFWSAVLPPKVVAAWSAALTAPFVEEAAKAGCAAVILVLCGSVLNRVAHALMVGMFTGFGFDVSEDLGYVAQGAIQSLDSDLIGAIPVLGGRVLTAVPAHWSYTGLTTVGVFLLLPTFSGRAQWPPARRVPVACGLMLCGPLLHFVWDSPLNDGLFTIVGSLVFFVVIVLLLLRFERHDPLAL
ncbi:MAG TPA: PrsW family glutamic-type intramembrane protease, partial [Mycobacterium sp.]|nr:PrsW family glutamic-type intramembrane protease [Mycobacterium sp.]